MVSLRANMTMENLKVSCIEQFCKRAWLQYVGMKMAYPAVKLGDARSAVHDDAKNEERSEPIITEARDNLLSKIGLVMGRSFGPLFAMVIILGVPGRDSP